MVELDPAHIVGIGGAIGAILRHYVSQQFDIKEFPVGTFTVNVLGSFVLGFITFLGVDSQILLFVGIGACGSFTTFSSFSFETVRLWETGERGHAVVNAAVHLVGAVIAIGLAWVLAQLFL